MNHKALKISLIYTLAGVPLVLIVHILPSLLYDGTDISAFHMILEICIVFLTAAFIYWILCVHQPAENILDTSGKLFEENPNPMWVYDTKTLKILAVNEAALAVYQYTRQEFLKLKLLDIRPEKEYEKLLKELEISSAEEEYKNRGIWLHKKKSGANFFVNIYSHKIAFKQREACLIIALDVHDRYLAARQIRKQNEKLKEIAYIQSHKMRGPVATIMGLISLFNMNCVENDFHRELMEKITLVCTNLDDIIHQVVDKTSEIEANNL